MASKKKNDFFWISFSDLMTSMFFVMLVLFVLTVAYLKIEQKKIEDFNVELIEEKGRLEKIVQLDEQFDPLRSSGAFHYLESCEKFIAKDLMGQEIFEAERTEILPAFIEPTIEIGKKLERFLNDLQVHNSNFSYLVVLEGNMANTWDQRYSKDSQYGFKTSYERALAVYNLWLDNNIDFRKHNVEVLISGSGFNGLCREPVEENNKRFSIQIIPKVSNNI